MWLPERYKYINDSIELGNFCTMKDVFNIYDTIRNKHCCLPDEVELKYNCYHGDDTEISISLNFSRRILNENYEEELKIYNNNLKLQREQDQAKFDFVHRVEIEGQKARKEWKNLSRQARIAKRTLGRNFLK